MTLCTAWIRKNKDAEELMIATDSRLRSFGSWDCNPKIFTFSRTDCAMCFAGDTTFAYPMMIQIKNAIDTNPKIRSRFQRIGVFKGILIKIMNDMLKQKSDYELPEIKFLFAGYDWQKSEFKIWKIVYQKGIEKFTSHKIKHWRGVEGNKKVVFIGDYIDEAKSRLIEKLKENGNLMSGDLNYEPLQVISEMLIDGQKDNKYSDIGGSPQLIKLYKHSNRTPIAIDWTENENKLISLFGRPVAESSLLNPILNPFTLKYRNSNKFY